MEGEVSWASPGHAWWLEGAREGRGEATATAAACRARSCVLVPGKTTGEPPGGLGRLGLHPGREVSPFPSGFLFLFISSVNRFT